MEQEIIVWVNQKLEEAGKETRVNSFQDSKIATALPVIDLIDAIKPGVINYEVLQEGGNYEVRVLLGDRGAMYIRACWGIRLSYELQ